MTSTDHKATDELLHKLWGLAHDQPGYVKEDWMKLQAAIQRTQAACDPPCPRCDERDEHEAQAQDGLINAYEMAGLQ